MCLVDYLHTELGHFSMYPQQCLLSSGKKKKKKKANKKKKLDVATGNIKEAGSTGAIVIQGAVDGSEKMVKESVEGVEDGEVKCVGGEEEEPVAMEALAAGKGVE